MINFFRKFPISRTYRTYYRKILLDVSGTEFEDKNKNNEKTFKQRRYRRSCGFSLDWFRRKVRRRRPARVYAWDDPRRWWHCPATRDSVFEPTNSSSTLHPITTNTKNQKKSKIEKSKNATLIRGERISMSNTHTSSHGWERTWSMV